MKYPGLITAVALVLIASSGCSKKPDAQPSRRPPIRLRLIYPTEAGPLLREAINRYASSDPRLSDGREITISMAARAALSGALDIAKGKEKTDLWLAPSQSIINLVNASLANLGPTQVNCTTVFGTPIVAALRKKTLNELRTVDPNFTISTLLTPQEEPLDFYFSHPDPLHSTAGLGVLAQLADVAARTAGFAGVADYSFKKVGAAVKHMQLRALRYSTDSVDLLQLLYSDKVATRRFVVTTEQQVTEFNKGLGIDRAKRKADIVTAFFDTGVYVQEYQLCSSDADWVTNAKHAAIRHLTEFLNHQQLDTLKLENSFRPVHAPQVESEDESGQSRRSAPSAENSQGEESAPTLDSIPGSITRPLDDNLLGQLADAWPALKRRAAVAAILDTSGSMTEEQLNTGKSLIEKIMRKLNPDDLKALVSFASEVTVEEPPATAVEPLIKSLWKLKAAGGSSIYDSLKQSIDLLTLQSDKDYRKIIVIYTDGVDKNSSIALSTVKGALCRRVRNKQISLIVVAIGSPQIDYTDLADIAHSCGGIFYEAGLNDMNTLYATSLSTL